MVSPLRLVNANEIRICVTNTNTIDYSLMCHLGITFDTLILLYFNIINLLIYIFKLIYINIIKIILNYYNSIFNKLYFLE